MLNLNQIFLMEEKGWKRRKGCDLCSETKNEGIYETRSEYQYSICAENENQYKTGQFVCTVVISSTIIDRNVDLSADQQHFIQKCK